MDYRDDLIIRLARELSQNLSIRCGDIVKEASRAILMSPDTVLTATIFEVDTEWIPVLRPGETQEVLRRCSVERVLIENVPCDSVTAIIKQLAAKGQGRGGFVVRYR